MKRFLKILVAMTLCVGLVSGCTQASPSSSGSTPAGGEKKVLRVGFTPMSAPFCWTQYDDANGALPVEGSDEYANGFDVAMMKKICDLAGYELQVYCIDWDGLLLAVQTGTIDCAAADIGITEERKASMEFSDPYYQAGFTCLVRTDSPWAGATGLSELSGVTCTSQLNTMWYDMISQIPNANKQPGMDNLSAMVVSLQSGTTDLLLMDEPTAMAVVTANPDLKMLVLKEGDDFVVTPEQTDIGIAIGKGNTQLVEDLNKAIAQISREEAKGILENAIKTQPLLQE